MATRSLPPTIPTQFDRCAPSVTQRYCNEPDNQFAQCIKFDSATWARIARDPRFLLKQIPARYTQLKSLPFDEMPPDALRLFAAPTTPVLFNTLATADAYTVVMSYLVPAGYDGVINVTVNKFVPQAGPDFQDGSGMLTWALGINNVLATNYSKITITLGASSVLGPVTKGGGIRVRANDLIQYMVSPNAAGIATLDPNGIIVCAVQGWLYPNR